MRSKCLDVSVQAGGPVNEELLRQGCFGVYSRALELTDGVCVCVCLDAVLTVGGQVAVRVLEGHLVYCEVLNLDFASNLYRGGVT